MEHASESIKTTGLVAWFVNNAVAANLLMVGIVFAGFIGFFKLDKEFFPSVTPTTAEISVAWPGASAQEVEQQLVIKIEESLTDMDSIERIRSTALEGYARIQVEGLARTERDSFVNDIQSRVDAIRGFPSDIEPPRVTGVVYRNQMMRVAVSASNLSEKQLKHLAEDLRDEVAALPYISVVELFGVRAEEVSVEISEESIRRYGISFDEVTRAIRGSSINLSSGTVKTETGDIQLRANNLANTQLDFENVIVKQLQSGATIRVKDVATVNDGFEDNKILATINGEPTILVQVMTSESGMDIVSASAEVNEWIIEARKRMPEGVSLILWDDMATVFNSRMETIGGSAIYGLLLVCLVLMFTLRPSVALWVSVGIAVAYTGTFVLLPYTGVSINILSTFAFLLVLGIIVDDAIVVGESIHRVSEKEGGGTKAAILGTQLVLKPVFFGVLTTIVAFAPWLFVSGETAQVTRHISIVILLALSFSLIEAFFILPAHLRKLKKQQSNHAFSRFQHKIERSLTTFSENHYRRWIIACLDHRYTTLIGFIGVLVISFVIVGTGWVKFNFSPDIESDQIIVNVELVDGTPYSRALEVLAQMQDAEKALVAEISKAHAKEDSEGNLVEGKLIENWYTRSRRDSVIAIIKLVPPENRALATDEAVERFRALLGDIPDAKKISYLAGFDGNNPDLEYSVSHADRNKLTVAIAELKAQLGTYSAVHEIQDSLEGSTQEILFTLLPGAERMGLTLAELSRQVRQAYYGDEAQRLPRANGDVRVMVRYPRELRNSMESLKEFRVRLPDGRQVPLLSVAEMEYKASFNRIDRRQRLRSATVSAEVYGDKQREVQQSLKDDFIDQWKEDNPGVILGAIGESEGEAEFLSEIKGLYFIVLFVIYALLAIAFRSYFLPVLIMTAIPFAFMGAVFGHGLWGVSMAIFSYFGIGAAVGVVINDNLVLIDAAERERKAGSSVREAIIYSGVTRFRPILLTSVTTLVGLTPMMLEQSIQAQFLIPAVISLAFGVFFAAFVTLFLVPALYLIGEDARGGLAPFFPVSLFKDKYAKTTLDE